jgi:hypothetical protein
VGQCAAGFQAFERPTVPTVYMWLNKRCGKCSGAKAMAPKRHVPQ